MNNWHIPTSLLQCHQQPWNALCCCPVNKISTIESVVLLMCFCSRVICLCTKSPFSVWLYRRRPGTFSRPEWKRAHGFSPGQLYPNTEWLCNCEPYRARKIIKRWTQTWEEDCNMKDYTGCIRNIKIPLFVCQVGRCDLALCGLLNQYIQLCTFEWDFIKQPIPT